MKNSGVLIQALIFMNLENTVSTKKMKPDMKNHRENRIQSHCEHTKGWRDGNQLSGCLGDRVKLGLSPAHTPTILSIWGTMGPRSFNMVGPESLTLHCALGSKQANSSCTFGICYLISHFLSQWLLCLVYNPLHNSQGM